MSLERNKVADILYEIREIFLSKRCTTAFHMQALACQHHSLCVHSFPVLNHK